MPRTRSLVLSVEVKPAKKLCRCSHNKSHLIPRTNLRLVVKEPNGMGEKGYCGSCAQKMLAAAKHEVEELQAVFAPADNRT